MNTTIEALQNLYVKLGGDFADVENITTIPDMLDALSTVAAQAASELPVVKAEDNGKVLAVVDGNWDKADAPMELPAVTGDDVGKVLSVVSDGESGAEYALETPSGGGLPEVTSADNGKILEVINGEFEVVYPKNVKTLTIEGTIDNPTITFPSGFTRETFFSSLILQGGLKLDNCLYSVNLFSSDYTKMPQGNLVVTGVSYLYKGTGSALFLHGIVGDGMDSTGNTLHEVTAVIGQTNGNNDAVNVKPYTFSTT